MGCLTADKTERLWYRNVAYMEGKQRMFWGMSKEKKQEQALQSARQKIATLVAEHLSILGRRRLALIRVDAYGVVDAKDWMKECQHFVDKVVRPKLTDDEAQAVAASGLNRLMTEMLEGPARRECARLEVEFSFDESMSPLDYEQFCAIRLRSAGWSCELTKSSGDKALISSLRRTASF